jgi:transposase
MQWVKRFEEGGLDSLLSIKAGRGRKARVSSNLSEEFSKAVISLQKNRNGGRVIGQDVVNLVQEKYDVQYSVSGIYKVLSRMGLSWVSGRSIHPQADLEAQEAFKKTLNKL